MGTVVAPAAALLGSKWLPAGLSIGSGLLGAAGSSSAAGQGLRAANRQQDIYNQQARQAVQAGAFESDLAIEQGRQVAASQRTGYAANGVDVSTGSAARVQDSTLRTAALDAEQIRRNSFNQAFGLVSQGNESVYAARAAAGSQRSSGFGSLLTGGAAALRFLR